MTSPRQDYSVIKQVVILALKWSWCCLGREVSKQILEDCTICVINLFISIHFSGWMYRYRSHLDLDCLNFPVEPAEAAYV